MKRPAISIIVPIFNMQDYLIECLDSILSQTFKDWECILVDDGSTDSSPEICDKYALRDSRFIVIHKSNGGVSSARNEGLKACKADFIGFVDPDDWIEPTLFEHLYNLILENDADIAQVGYWREYRGRRSVKHQTKEVKVIDGKTAMEEIAFDRLHNYLWNRLHRRSIINCHFPEGRVFEDIFAYGHWLKNVRSMVIDPTPLYHYRMRKGSIVHDANHRTDFFLSCIDRMKLIRELVKNEEDLEKINAYINKSAVNACKRIARQEKNIDLRNEAIHEISKSVNTYPLPSIKFMGLKMWFRAHLLRNHPTRFSSFMRIIHLFDFDSKHRNKHLYK